MYWRPERNVIETHRRNSHHEWGVQAAPKRSKTFSTSDLLYTIQGRTKAVTVWCMLCLFGNTSWLTALLNPWTSTTQWSDTTIRQKNLLWFSKNPLLLTIIFDKIYYDQKKGFKECRYLSQWLVKPQADVLWSCVEKSDDSPIQMPHKLEKPKRILVANQGKLLWFSE